MITTTLTTFLFETTTQDLLQMYFASVTKNVCVGSYIIADCCHERAPMRSLRASHTELTGTLNFQGNGEQHLSFSYVSTSTKVPTQFSKLRSLSKYSDVFSTKAFHMFLVVNNECVCCARICVLDCSLNSTWKT